MANTIDIWPAVNPLSRNTVADGAAIQRATIQPLVERTDKLLEKLDEIGDGNIPALTDKLNREIADREQGDTNLGNEINNEAYTRRNADNDIINRVDEIYEEIDDTINFVPGEGIEFVEQDNNTIAITAGTNPQGDAKFGIFNKKINNYIAYNNGGWTFSKKTGSLEISQDETTITGLKQNKIYHVTCEGSYKVISQTDYILAAYIQDNDGDKHYFDVDLTNNINREIPVTITFDYLAEVPGSNNDYVFVFTKWGSDETSDTTYNVSFEIKSLSLHEIASVTANEGESPEPPQPVAVPEIKAYGLKISDSAQIYQDGKIVFTGSQITGNTITFTDNTNKEIVLKNNALYKCDAILKIKPKNAVQDAYQKVTIKIPFKGNGSTNSDCFLLYHTIDLSDTAYETIIPLSWQLTDATKLFINISGLESNIYVHLISLQLIEIIT
jgi:hypothetical protein